MYVIQVFGTECAIDLCVHCFSGEEGQNYDLDMLNMLLAYIDSSHAYTHVRMWCIYTTNLHVNITHTYTGWSPHLHRQALRRD